MAAPRIWPGCHCCVSGPTGWSWKSATSGPRAEAHPRSAIAIPPYPHSTSIGMWRLATGLARLSDESVERLALGGGAEAGPPCAVHALLAFPGEGVGEQFCARTMP